MLVMTVLIGFDIVFGYTDVNNEISECRKHLKTSEVWVLTAGDDYILMSKPNGTLTDTGRRVMRVGKVSAKFLYDQIQYLQQFYASDLPPLTEVYRAFTNYWRSPIFWAGVAIGLVFATIGVCTSIIITCIWVRLKQLTNYVKVNVRAIKKRSIQLSTFISSRMRPIRQPLFNDSVILSPRDQMNTNMLHLS